MKLLCLLIEPKYFHEKTLKTHRHYPLRYLLLASGVILALRWWMCVNVKIVGCSDGLLSCTNHPFHPLSPWLSSREPPSSQVSVTPVWPPPWVLWLHTRTTRLFRGTCLHFLGVAEEAGWHNNVLCEIIRDDGADGSRGGQLLGTESSARCPLRRWSTEKLWIQTLERKVSKQRKM